MKRKFFAAFAVLLALMLATCDLFESDTKDVQPKFTEDGRPLVHLSIGLGNKAVSRAMSLGQAQDIVGATGDWYEVAFKDPNPSSTKIYRAWWDFDDGESGEITVPAGIYTLADQAILFAGRKSDNTLLAIGIISEVDNMALSLQPTSGVAEIFSTTTSVTFTLYALDSSVNKTSSSFEILGPTVDSLTGDDFSSKTIGELLTGGFVFTVPGHNYASTIDDTTGPSAATNGSTMDTIENIVGRYTFKYGVGSNDGSLFAGVKVANNNWVHAINYTDKNEHSNKTTVELVTRYPQEDEAIPSDGGFYFNIIVKDLTANEDGLHKLYMAVPVYAIGDSTEDPPETWYIRGGLDNTDFDGGASTDTGGAFLLNVGGLVDLEIKKDGP